jgi:O-methyltransferase involved in polyketide biosynthesis
LTSTPQGVTDYVDADLRDPDRILNEAARTLDFIQPIAITMLGVVIFITDHEAFRIVDRLIDALPSGSHLAMTHTTNAVNGPDTDEAVRIWNEGGSAPMVVRSLEQIGRFFHGLELLEPGVVSLNRWRPDPIVTTTGDVDEFCAVGRKP